MAVAFKVAGNAPARMTANRQKEKPKNPWEPYYAWRPIKVGRKIVWRKWIFRRFVTSPGGGFYKYGTEFDVMRWSPD